MTAPITPTELAQSAAMEAELLRDIATAEAALLKKLADWRETNGAEFPFFSPACRLPEPLIDLDNPQNPMVPQGKNFL